MKPDLDVQGLTRIVARKEELERQLHERREALLKTLPRMLAFHSMHELIAALQRCASGRRQPVARFAKRRPRLASKGVRYDNSVKARVRQALESGQTATSVARRFGPSLPTVTSWKRKWGLTRSSKRGKVAVRATRPSRKAPHVRRGLNGHGTSPHA